MTERGSAEVAFPVVGELGHAETLRRGPESRVVVRLLRQHPDLQPPPPLETPGPEPDSTLPRCLVVGMFRHRRAYRLARRTEFGFAGLLARPFREVTVSTYLA